MLDADSLSLDVAVEITADTEEIVKRLLKRATEQNRADDTEPVIRHRMEVYTAQTQPLVVSTATWVCWCRLTVLVRLTRSLSVSTRLYQKKLGRQI